MCEALPYAAWYVMTLRSPDNLTPRQRLMQVLAGPLRSARDLARELGLPEREIEDNLVHVVRSLKRDRSRRFLIEPATCSACGFEFRERTKLTCPSRCPKCHDESIIPPRFRIELTSQ